MSFEDQILTALRSDCGGIWVNSYEHADALAAIERLCDAPYTRGKPKYPLLYWNAAQGTTSHDNLIGVKENDLSAKQALDLLESIHTQASVVKARIEFSPERQATLPRFAVAVMENLHLSLCDSGGRANLSVAQAVINRIIQNAGTNRCLIVLANEQAKMPVELERLFVVVNHELPKDEELLYLVNDAIAKDGSLPKYVKGQAEAENILAALRGLTRLEALTNISLAQVETGTLALDPAKIWTRKIDTINRTAGLSIYVPDRGFDMLGGMSVLKDFCLRAVNSPHRTGRAKPYGVLLLGPPGVGKSEFAKALGKEVKMPTVLLDPGALFGKYIGQSETQVRTALNRIDEMGRAVVFIDEIEKAVGGMYGGGSGDSGVAARVGGTLLTWLSEHKSDVFVICTSNDIKKLPPEFYRNGRFDGVFMIPLPGEEQRQAIWTIAKTWFDLASNEIFADDKGWTGADIFACVKAAKLLGLTLEAAAQYVVPASEASSEAMDEFNKHSGRCLCSEYPGPYRHGFVPGQVSKASTRVRRSVVTAG